MDVRLTPEQVALRDSAAQLAERLGPATVASLDDTERAAKLEAAVAAAGWREIRGPGEGTSPLGSAVEAALVAEELGRCLVDAPYLGPTLAADLRRVTDAPVAGSDETVLLAPDLSACATAETTPDGDGWRHAVAVDAAGAASAVALHPDPAGATLVTVPLGPAPFGPDLTRPFRPPSPSDGPSPVPGRALTGEQGATWTALGLTLTSADLVGIMRGAVRLAVDYVSERRQYGRPVGSFQAVQHLLADAHVATEGSRSVALHAAWAVDALAPEDALAAAAAAKAYCARAARTVCETVIQAHGGIGNTWDCLAHVYLRRALVSIDALGGVGPNLDRVLRHRGLGGVPA